MIGRILVLFATLATAINFADYDPQPGVEPEFQTFLNAMVTQAESKSSGGAYTDYFTPDGRQTTLTLDCVGPAAITKCQLYFLQDGRDLVHWPSKTFVVSNNATATVYESHGRIENTYPPPGNCSQIYYKTQYTILKTKQGVQERANLTPAPQHQVYWYHDYFVNPTTVPSDIACDSLKENQ